MVNTRMEGRVDNLEKEFGTMKEDMETVKMWIMDVRDTLTRIEGCEKGQEESPQGENSGTAAGVNERAGNTQNIEKDPMRFRKLDIPLFMGEDPVG